MPAAQALNAKQVLLPSVHRQPHYACTTLILGHVFVKVRDWKTVLWKDATAPQVQTRFGRGLRLATLLMGVASLSKRKGDDVELDGRGS